MYGNVIMVFVSLSPMLGTHCLLLVLWLVLLLHLRLPEGVFGPTVEALTETHN